MITAVAATRPSVSTRLHDGSGLAVSEPTWFSDSAKKRRQNRSSARQERTHAQRTGGRTQAGSGSSWRAKGDVVGTQYVDELKETHYESFSITKKIINTLLQAAGQRGLEPRLIIDMHAVGVRAVVTFEDIP